jgi:hypothetical protein
MIAPHRESLQTVLYGRLLGVRHPLAITLGAKCIKVTGFHQAYPTLRATSKEKWRNATKDDSRVSGIPRHGFADAVGPFVSLAKGEFQLSNAVASLIPLVGFSMFGLLSVPVGVFQDKRGKKFVLMFNWASWCPSGPFSSLPGPRSST